MKNTPSNRFSSKALEDFRLIDKAMEGEETAYTQLLAMYKRPVYHMILKMVKTADDAEDLTIESFAKAFRNLHRFKKDFTFSTWLFRVASNNTIDFLRKKRLNTLSIDSTYTDSDGKAVPLDLEDGAPTPQERAIRIQKRELIRNFVDTLPEKYQILLRLRYFDELSYEEITKKLQIPLGTVKAQLHRARELLYNIVKDKKSQI